VQPFGEGMQSSAPVAPSSNERNEVEREPADDAGNEGTTARHGDEDLTTGTPSDEAMPAK
jgi:hypothetical protein